MARINLLPWRAERRKQREREFYMQLGLAAVAGIFIVLVWAMWMGARIDNQHDRNAYLRGEIKQVDNKIAKIKSLEKVRDQLLARKKIIEHLQDSRSQMVHLFDELVKTIPPSVELTKMSQTGDRLTLNGVAQSNSSIANYMRNLEASPWMTGVDLDHTTKDDKNADKRMPYEFKLTVNLTKPKSGDDKSAAAKQGGAKR